MTTIYLSNFKVIRPTHEVSQEKLLELIAHFHTKAEASVHQWDSESQEAQDFFLNIRQKLFSLGFGEGKIQKRGVQITDIAKIEKNSFSTLKDKQLHFDQEVLNIFKDFYPDQASFCCPHLIHATCTGYIAPSGAQKIVSIREMGDKVTVTHAYHMGCYAAIPSIRMAIGHLKHSGESSDIVHTEICSLHVNPFLHSVGHLVSQSLFSDGFIKYSVQNSNEKTPQGLEILAIHEIIIPDSIDAMHWIPHDEGFYISLSKEIPVLIARSLEKFLFQLCEKAKMDPTILKQAYFAIHPGGPKIIELIGKTLGLVPAQLQHSIRVLKEYGNMSSATLPHIWKAILEDSSIPVGELIMSLAFGPGLSISGALFKKI